MPEIPTGLIAIWSGAIVDIPTGWALCDGGNGRPDLRDKFIVGAGGSYSPGNVGGAAAHTHARGGYAGPNHTHARGSYAGPNHTHARGSYASPTSGGHAITIAEMAAHTHQIDISSAAGTTGKPPRGTGVHMVWGVTESTGGGGSHTHPGGAITGSSAAGGTGAVTGASAAGGTGAVTGTSASAGTLPPYYALCYIIKT